MQTIEQTVKQNQMEILNRATKIQQTILQALHNGNIPSPILSVLSGTLYSMKPETVLQLADKVIEIARALGAPETCCSRAAETENKIHSIDCPAM